MKEAVYIKTVLNSELEFTLALRDDNNFNCTFLANSARPRYEYYNSVYFGILIEY